MSCKESPVFNNLCMEHLKTQVVTEQVRLVPALSVEACQFWIVSSVRAELSVLKPVVKVKSSVPDLVR